MTVVFKCLPDQLREMLKFEKRCLKLMAERYTRFIRNLDKIRMKELEGEKRKTLLLYPVQIEKTDFSGNATRYKYAAPPLKSLVQNIESKLE